MTVPASDLRHKVPKNSIWRLYYLTAIPIRFMMELRYKVSRNPVCLYVCISIILVFCYTYRTATTAVMAGPILLFFAI